jgi:RNA polymerase sigma-70 factor (ECF subfamily)
MGKTPDNGRDDANRRPQGASAAMRDLKDWFIREVLPLESALMQFLRQNWRDKADIADLRQDVYVRVFEAAQKQIPDTAKPFVLTTARNLLIDRVRRERVIAIETMADLETLGAASNEVSVDRALIARDALAKLQAALDKLPPQCREAILLRKVEGLSRGEIAERMGVTERTVNRHIAEGMRALADMLYSEAADLRRKS